MKHFKLERLNEIIKKLAHILDLKYISSIPQCPGCHKRCMECMDNGESTHVQCDCGVMYCFLCTRTLYNTEQQYLNEMWFGIDVANCNRNLSGPFPDNHNENSTKDVNYNPLLAVNFKRCPKTFKELNTYNGFNTQGTTEARHRFLYLKSLLNMQDIFDKIPEDLLQAALVYCSVLVNTVYQNYMKH